MKINFVLTGLHMAVLAGIPGMLSVLAGFASILPVLAGTSRILPLLGGIPSMCQYWQVFSACASTGRYSQHVPLLAGIPSFINPFFDGSSPG